MTSRVPSSRLRLRRMFDKDSKDVCVQQTCGCFPRTPPHSSEDCTEKTISWENVKTKHVRCSVLSGVPWCSEGKPSVEGCKSRLESRCGVVSEISPRIEVVSEKRLESVGSFGEYHSAEDYAVDKSVDAGIY